MYNIVNKRFAIFLPSGLAGGAENLLTDLAIYLTENGARVTIFLLSDKNIDFFKERIGNNHCEIIFSKTHSEAIGFFLFPYYLIKNRGPQKYDYILSSHCHINAYISIYRAFGILKVNWHTARESTRIFDRFNGGKLLFFRLCYFIGYKKIERIVCQTSLMRNELLSNVHFNDINRVVVLQNPSPRFSFTQLSNDPSFKGKRYMVAAGRLIQEKGFDLLIKAWSFVCEKYPELNLIILGDGNDREMLHELILNLNLSKKVFLIGWKKNVHDYFKNAEVCIISSRIEGFPNTLLQMMQVNDSIVCTTCTDSITSIPGLSHCRTNDVDNLASAIINCYQKKASNKQNRILFDKFLNSNNIDNYVKMLIGVIK